MEVNEENGESNKAANGGTSLIEVEVHGHCGYVWRLTDVIRLRKKHHVLGNLIGCAARYPREEPGLPLLLNPIEIQALKDEGVVRLVEIRSFNAKPNQDTVDRSMAYREESFNQQIQIFKNEKEKQILSYADRILEGKKKKLLSKLKKKQKIDKEITDEDIQKEIQQINREDVIKEEVDKIQPITKDHQIVEISTRDPWILPIDKCDAKWSFPSGDVNKCRLLTYKKLWKQGYYVSEGSKFGGDFLVYLGDPVRFHAKYIVICLGRKKLISAVTRPLELISRSRLGNQVRKSVLVSSLVGSNDVVFKSITRPKPKEVDQQPSQSYGPEENRDYEEEQQHNVEEYEDNTYSEMEL